MSQTAKSARTSAKTASRSASSHRASETAGRAGSGDSWRPARRAVLSLGLDGLRLEPLYRADSRSVAASVPWDALTDAERVERLNDEIRRYAEALGTERATLARLSAAWVEYDALTRHDWVCNRAMDLRVQIRKLLDVKA